MLVQELEAVLFEQFPREDAEVWDHVGLSVGDPLAEVHAVACALDATLANVRSAADRGANVLLTHHPVYIKAPNAFTPEHENSPLSASAVYEAARLGVSIISMHTNLDRSIAAQKMLPSLLGLSANSSLEYASEPKRTGLGALSTCTPMSLKQLAQKSSHAFMSKPRVWGDPHKEVTRVAFLGGSLGDFGELALAAHADALITGECGYHTALDLSTRGLSLILLGHDRSEEPFVRLLKQASATAGVPQQSIYSIHPSFAWWTLV